MLSDPIAPLFLGHIFFLVKIEFTTFLYTFLQIMDQSSTPDGMQEAPDSVDASDYLDMDGASALVINTDDNDDSPNEGDDSKRSNTSKNKLESLLGKEFKHPRRKCGICGC